VSPALGEADISLTGPSAHGLGIDRMALADALDRVETADSIDWLTMAATLKPKNGLFADWLATTGEA
jgi:hypothetical protein